MAITYHAGRRIQGNTSEYKVHKFTSTGTFAVTGSGDIEYLVVAGGGGAGKDGFPSGRGTGGGGAGGFRTNVSGAITGGGGSAESTYSATAQNYTITVGSGGAGGTGSGSSTVGSDGVNSSIVPASGTSIISTGGGGGGGHDDSANFEGRDGGSGGGAPNANSSSYVGEAVTNPVQGHDGGSQYNSSPYYGSGGGGAGSVGGSASNSGSGNGGLGLQSSILTASAVFYAGGGGGHGSSSYGSGGSGIGGSGASGTGGAGTVNTGSGGGSGTTAGAGGSGIVIIRYKTSSGITATGGDTITTIDGIQDTAPENVQVGSRYEETNTRKMYHYNENTPLIDESFASTPAMTWETNGGSSNMVYTVDTTTNHRAQQNSTGNSGFTHGTCIGDIGQTLSTNWVMRINLVHTGWESPDGGNQSINFWVSSKKQQTSGNADHAGLFWHTVSNSGGSGDGSGGAISGIYSGMYAFVSNDQASPSPTSVHNGAERIGTGVSNPVDGENRYIEFIKNGNTFTMTDFGTDSTFTTSVDTMDIVNGDKNMQSGGSFSQSQMSAISGLRYIHLGLYGSDNGGGTYIVYCNMIKIWDNVTEAPTDTHSWSEEGT